MRLHSVTMDAGAYAIGRSLADLRLPETGIEISALRRQRVRIVDPAPETRLELEDVLVLLGTPSQLANAETRLFKGI